MYQIIWKDIENKDWFVNLDYKKCDEYFEEYLKCKNLIEAKDIYKKARNTYFDYLDTQDDVLEKEFNRWDNDLSVRNKEYNDYSKPNQPLYRITTKDQWVSHTKLLNKMVIADNWAQLLAAQAVLKNFK